SDNLTGWRGIIYSGLKWAVSDQIVRPLTAVVEKSASRGGHVTIETETVLLDEDYARRHPEVQPGWCVLLAVSDTGTGMTQDVKAHLFEPFFTTKEKGRGTGLGLATVYGIVKQSNGCIEVSGEWGVGTTFKVYFPCVEREGDETATTHIAHPSGRGDATILLVEDEVSVRQITRRILERDGYVVLEASLPSEALRIGREHLGDIDLLITDVVMPEMGGRDLAEQMIALHPDFKVLYISGYSHDAIAHHGILDLGVDWLEKPFLPEALTDKVREMLDRV
ncbi:MAG: response regulator, partial [Anaerolineae bacterium]|nr:response regulator [Anaerolineae bacterium]